MRQKEFLVKKLNLKAREAFRQAQEDNTKVRKEKNDCRLMINDF
jgi:hypothetical protein